MLHLTRSCFGREAAAKSIERFGFTYGLSLRRTKAVAKQDGDALTSRARRAGHGCVLVVARVLARPSHRRPMAVDVAPVIRAG